MTATVHDVVALFTARAPHPLSMSTIHRLAYFAQGWHLAWAGTPLFEEELRIRESGPVVHALFPHQTDGLIQEAWPVGDPAALTAAEAQIAETVFDSYWDSSGISLGKIAHKHSPCISAAMRKTEEDTQPVIDLAELKAFFKAFDDAPDDQIAYANRFIANYS
jgi:uncharacterized phage-associated protein